MTELSVERVERLATADMNDLVDATEVAIKDGLGFGWIKVPPRERLEAYWNGVLAVPQRELFVARLDGVICGSAQLVHPAQNNEIAAFATQLQRHFVAPWARGHGLARRLVEAAEQVARRRGYQVMRFEVRATQKAAIALYESLGYELWGVLPQYALIDGRMIAGHFYSKELT